MFSWKLCAPSVIQRSSCVPLDDCHITAIKILQSEFAFNFGNDSWCKNHFQPSFPVASMALQPPDLLLLRSYSGSFLVIHPVSVEVSYERWGWNGRICKEPDFREDAWDPQRISKAMTAVVSCSFTSEQNKDQCIPLFISCVKMMAEHCECCCCCCFV